MRLAAPSGLIFPSWQEPRFPLSTEVNPKWTAAEDMPDDFDTRTYFQRRLDDIRDDRIERVEARLDRLEGRLNYLFGAMAVLVIAIQLVVPIIGRYIAP